MTRAIQLARAFAVLVGIVALSACSTPDHVPGGEDPGAVALRLFAMAGGEPTPDALEGLFDPDALSGDRVSLLDALDTLADSPSPELVAVDAVLDGDEAFADLTAELPGGGRAAYSVKLRQIDAGGWRVSWFQGPGVEWPPRRTRGEGLSTSSPP